MKTPKRAENGSNLLINSGPWILATACLLLLCLLTLFSFSSYQREKELMVEGLVQKGLTLMRFVNSSVRVLMIENLRSLQTLIPWESHMTTAMEQAVEQPGVEYILLVDHLGNIISAAGTYQPEQKLDDDTLALVNQVSRERGRPYVVHIKKSGLTERRKFQIASPYRPPEIGRRIGATRDHPPQMRRMMGNFSFHPQFHEVQAVMERLAAMHAVYIVQLNFEQFNSPLQRQLLQIIILLVVLGLVGAGGTLSFTTLKGLKGSQQRLGKIRAFTDMLVSALPVGLIATDSSGMVQVFNSTAAAILGVRPEDAVGRIPADGVPQELQPMFLGRQETQEYNRQAEIELGSDSGLKLTLHLTSMVVLDETESFAGEVLLIRDLTEVRALEKELQTKERLAALGKMAAGVAHELRNPLSSIKGLAVLLKGKFPGDSNEAAAADMLVKEVERLNRSIGEMLDYAKPGQLTLQPASIDSLIRKTLSLVTIDAQSYGIDVRLECKDSLPEIEIDKDKLQQVFLNLFLNSIQAMESGGKLLVSLEKIDQSAIIVVEDNGIGIHAENIGRVCDPYFTTKNNGTGLGLAMTAKIIQEHAGQLEISSESGQYTRVKISLPLSRQRSSTP